MGKLWESPKFPTYEARISRPLKNKYERNSTIERLSEMTTKPNPKISTVLFVKLNKIFRLYLSSHFVTFFIK